jgi:hypothetical protein
VDPILGSLVYQLPGGVTLAFDLYLGHKIAHCKGIFEEINFWVSIRTLCSYMRFYIMKKIHLGPQNGPIILITKKLLKIVNCEKTVLSQLE